jgi:hypothetical protein
MRQTNASKTMAKMLANLRGGVLLFDRREATFIFSGGAAAKVGTVKRASHLHFAQCGSFGFTCSGFRLGQTCLRGSSEKSARRR